METSSLPLKDCISGPSTRTPIREAIQLLAKLDDQAASRTQIKRYLRLFSEDELLPLLKDESERYQYIDAHISLRLADALMLAAGLTGRPDHYALGLLARGDSLRCLGRIEESVATLNEAGRVFLEQGDEVGWARTRIGWIYASHLLGHGEAALPEADNARDLLIEHREWLRAAILDSNTAIVCYRLGKYSQALARYDRALDLYEPLGEAAEARAAMAKMNKAIVMTYLGDFATALRLHEESREIFLKHGETVMALRHEQNVAFVYWAQGYYTRALQHYGTAYAALEAAGLEIDCAWVALGMVDCYFRLNRIDEMLDMAEEAIRRFERHGMPTEAARARLMCALAHLRIGDSGRAFVLLDEAEHAFAISGHIERRAHVALRRALLYFSDERWESAQEEAVRASELFARLGLAIEQTEANLVQARAALAGGDRPTAIRLARSELLAVDAGEMHLLAHEVHHLMGRIAQEDGDFPQALDAYDQAITRIERMQRTLAIELRTNFLADKMTVYHDAIDACLRLSHPARAFTYLERAKSRALVDYLANNLEVQIRARAGTSQVLLDTLARLREECNWFQNQLYRLNATQRDEIGTDASEQMRLRTAIRDGEKQIGRIIERIALDRTEGLTIDPSSDDETRFAPPTVDPGTVLLEYYLRGDSGAIFVVSSAGISVVPLTTSPTTIHRSLQQWQLNLAGTAQAIASGRPLAGLAHIARGILTALHHAIIAPVAAHLVGVERLIIIPCGLLHAVPFHALFDGKRFLLETVEVTYSPSSSLLQLCANRPRHATRSALVIAHTGGGKLPGALREAQMVASLLPGVSYLEENATRAVVTTSAPDHGVIHLATHGEARLDNPAFAHLRLADGQLSAVDIFNLHLHGALVTLSACETGRSLITAGEELIGLSSGFLYAGATTIVQSLWRVEDDSTAQLMEHFYRNLCAGRPKGAALHAAQRALLGTDGAHPYFWAAFQLIGDGGAF